MKIELEYLQSSLKKEQVDCGEMLNRIHEKCQMTKRKVRNAMKYVRDLLDEHEKQMDEEIENFQREELKAIEDYQMKLKNSLDYFHFQNRSFQFFIQTNDQFNLLNNQIHFLHYLSQTKNQFNRFQIPSEIDYQIHGLELQQTIKELILQYGIIQEKTQISSQSQTNFEDLDLTEQNFNSAMEILRNNPVKYHLN